MSNLIIINARIITPIGKSALKGSDMNRLQIIEHGTIEITDGTITYVGENRNELPAGYVVVNAEGTVAFPGFVDSHTHLVFGGYRPEEFMWRMRGDSYMSIMERGGGIVNTMRATREDTPDELKRKAEWYIEVMSRMGGTTVEGKSGYGLDKDTEVKQLEVMRRINADTNRTVEHATT